MKKNEIKVGGHYRAKVSNRLTTVRVDAIRERNGFKKTETTYDVTNLSTGRKTTFRSATKFRNEVGMEPTTVSKKLKADAEAAAAYTVKKSKEEGEHRADPTSAVSAKGLSPATAPVQSADSSTPANATAGFPDEPSPRSSITTGLAAKLAAISLSSTDDAPHLIIEARAGTGKTTTLIEALNRLQGRPTPGFVPSPQQQAVFDEVLRSKGKVRSIAFVAFNKSIAKELQSRVPPGVEAKTMHGMGFSAVRRAFRLDPERGVSEDRVKNILAELVGKTIQEVRKENPVLVKAVVELVGLCKMNLIDAADRNELLALSDRHEVETNGCWDRVVELIPRVLDRCKDVTKDGCIDYDDMIWLPVVLDLPVFRFDLLLVDEAQDLNRCQQELAKRAGRRLILCGDPRQAIYGFAGADSESMPRLNRELTATAAGCVTLPLTVTRRCGKAIVAEAVRIVKDFSAHESNGEGKVTLSKYPQQPGRDFRDPPVTIPDSETYLPMVADGDMIVCRSNAPLTKQCLKFLRMGRRARIQGRSVGQGIISLITKLKAETVPDLIGKLDAWLREETAKEQAKANPDEAKIERLNDRYDSVMCFTEGATGTVRDVITKVESVFVDDPTVQMAPILLSSVHRAKGLECRRVFFLDPAVMPRRRRMPEWQRVQEDNLRYVAITRAIEELVYVV